MKKVLLLHATAGHGHKKVAEVIGAAFLRLGLKPEEVQVVDALEDTPAYFRKAYPAFYFYLVKHFPQLWGFFYESLDHLVLYRWIRPLRSFYNRIHSRKLLNRIEREKPDAVICTHFLSAEVLARAKREGKMKAFLMTVITDFAPHWVWINDGTDAYWVMTPEARQELIERGVHADIVDGGIPVDPIFLPAGKRSEVLKKHGFFEKRLTILLTSGSFGLGPYAEILKELEEFSDKIQCFVVCGNNDVMKKALDAEHFRYPIRIFGFVSWMPDLMEASDILLAKSGGATTVESLAKELPMIVLHPIPGQETRNADYLKMKNASFFMQEPAQIKPIIRSVFQYPAVMDQKKSQMREIARPNAANHAAQYILDHIA